MTAQRALDAQLEMIEWLGSDKGAGWEKWFLETLVGSAKITGHGLAPMLADSLGTAETVFVARPMCDVVEAAAEQMPDVPLQVENLFWPGAFVWFERPIRQHYRVTPGDDAPLATRAIAWVRQQVARSDKDRFGESLDVPEEHRLPGILHTTYVDIAQTPLSFGELRSPLFPFDLGGWAFGRHWQTVPHGDSMGAGRVDEGLAQQRKLLLAVNLLAAQYVAAVSGQRVTRAQRRRAWRMGLTAPTYGQINVVTLRRAHQRGAGDEPDEDFEYSHRFMVRGHWRHQWYPSRGEHELLWIDPFIKGPENKPLIIKDRIWNVAR